MTFARHTTIDRFGDEDRRQKEMDGATRDLNAISASLDRGEIAPADVKRNPLFASHHGEVKYTIPGRGRLEGKEVVLSIRDGGDGKLTLSRHGSADSVPFSARELPQARRIGSTLESLWSSAREVARTGSHTSIETFERALADFLSAANRREVPQGNSILLAEKASRSTDQILFYKDKSGKEQVFGQLRGVTVRTEQIVKSNPYGSLLAGTGIDIVEVQLSEERRAAIIEKVKQALEGMPR